MSTSPKNEPERVLVVGRSPSVLGATAGILRARGYSADATNQFDQVLDDYDVTDLDAAGADLGHRQPASPGQPGHDEKR